MPIRPENRALYPPDWDKISYRIRFHRANAQCEWIDHKGRCQAVHGRPHPITGSKVVLTTMHLDHNPANCADHNLLAACQLHHNSYDAPMRRQGIKARAHASRAIADLFDATTHQKQITTDRQILTDQPSSQPLMPRCSETKGFPQRCPPR